ncbi:hypothetical protein CBS101457_005031 [Exobasidium rhododendri]|nr:hypothetical protein CBS101457_005031 [Exobasidium rhododendri]
MEKSKFGTAPHTALQVPNFQEEMYKLTGNDWRTYEKILSEFATDAFQPRLAKWSRAIIKGAGADSFKPKKIPSFVWQTGISRPERDTGFKKLNPRATYNFYSDMDLEEWASRHFTGTVIKKIWDGMERKVLQADFWRYLILFVEGGYYSDTDTDCLKPIEDWGEIDVVHWDLNETSSDDVRSGPPQVVVGIEVDVPDLTGWETFWPRPIQIVQWTMAGAPGHPIYVDSIRRVVESMQMVKNWEAKNAQTALKMFETILSINHTLKDREKLLSAKGDFWNDIENILTTDPFDIQNGGVISLIEATGPGAFSDAVFSYLQARYSIHWSQLHNIQTVTRIGDVAIVPITGFAPFAKPDWQRWKGVTKGPMSIVGDITHPQALVNHLFSGSWRKESDGHIG